MVEIEIAIATAEDLGAIHRIETESFPAPWKREFFESELTANGRLNLVSRFHGCIVGYLFAMWYFDEMHVNKIAVEELARRQGVAEALMERCSMFARSQKVTSISLEVRYSNEGAQAFYRQLGFESTYMRARYYPDGEAAVVMTLELEAT